MGSDITLTPAVCCPADFNPRSPDGERPGLHHLPAKVQNISIHAPRMGSDRGRLSRRNGCADFNPRSPDGERRGVRHAPGVVANFNPRSPDGERPSRLGEHHRHAFISIHAPRMGSDRKGNRLRSRHSKFQSTLPGWGATIIFFLLYRLKRISIHAPRMGSDCSSRCLRMTAPIFQSTLPGWGATWDSPSSFSGAKISIHAPRMGSDLKSFADCLKPFLFQSTLPGWGATGTPSQRTVDCRFQSTLPGWGATTAYLRHSRIA